MNSVKESSVCVESESEIAATDQPHIKEEITEYREPDLDMNETEIKTESYQETKSTQTCEFQTQVPIINEDFEEEKFVLNEEEISIKSELHDQIGDGGAVQIRTSLKRYGSATGKTGKKQKLCDNTELSNDNFSVFRSTNQNIGSVDDIFQEVSSENNDCCSSHIDSDEEQDIKGDTVVNKLKTDPSTDVLNDDVNSIASDVDSDLSEVEDNNKTIIIRESKKDDCGKRSRDKVHSCYYCQKLCRGLSKHLTCQHAKESEVAKILAFPSRSVERRKGFIRLSRIGDYYHNCEVLKVKRGELILVRRPTPAEKLFCSFGDYGPCPDCLGFMIKKHIWHHIKYSCSEKQRTGTPSHRHLISESNALVIQAFSDEPTPPSFNKNVLSKLQNDAVSSVCQQDFLIVRFGLLQFGKYNGKQNEFIRQSMRQLARLIMELRKIDPTKSCLESWLKPALFDCMVAAVRNICKMPCTGKSGPDFGIPFLALKLGYNLKKCVTILKGVCLRNEDVCGVDELTTLMGLLESEWSFKIGSGSSSLKKKFSTTELLPVTEDLIKLDKHLNSKLKEATLLLNESPDGRTWTNLATIALSKLILFNKRRSKETATITVSQYSNRPLCLDKQTQNLSDLELNLALRLTAVQTTGQRSHVLFTPDVTEAVELLLCYRERFVSNYNPYLFAEGAPSTEHISGYDCFQKAELANCDLINDSKLRKHVGTVCQLLTGDATDRLTRHLGGSVKIHRGFYKLRSSAVELTKLSVILLTAEKGDVGTFKKKNLSQINICDLPDLPVDDDDDRHSVVGNAESNSSEVDVPCLPGSLSQMNSETEVKWKIRKCIVKRKWSEEESGAVLEFFGNYFKDSKSAPGKSMCEKCKDSSESLNSRTWKDIKFYVYNYLKKLNKEGPRGLD